MMFGSLSCIGVWTYSYVRQGGNDYTDNSNCVITNEKISPNMHILYIYHWYCLVQYINSYPWLSMSLCKHTACRIKARFNDLWICIMRYHSVWVCLIHLTVYVCWIRMAQDRLGNYRHLQSKCVVRCWAMRMTWSWGQSRARCEAACTGTLPCASPVSFLPLDEPLDTTAILQQTYFNSTLFETVILLCSLTHRSLLVLITKHFSALVAHPNTLGYIRAPHSQLQTLPGHWPSTTNNSPSLSEKTTTSPAELQPNN